MDDGFRLKEGMFIAVPCQTTDEGVLRLKRLVHGCRINAYEPVPSPQYHQEVRHNMHYPGMKYYKGKTPVDGRDGKTVYAHRLDQPPHVHQKKLAAGKIARELAAVEPPEKPVKKTKTAADKEDGNHTRHGPLDAGSTTSNHQNSLINSNGEITIMGNRLTDPTSNSVVSRKILVPQPSSILLRGKSQSPIPSQIRSKASASKQQSMPNLQAFLAGNGNSSSHKRSGTSAASKRHSRNLSSATKYRSSEIQNFPVCNRVGTPTAHQSKSSQLPSSSSGNRSKLISSPSATSGKQCNLSASLHRGTASVTPQIPKDISSGVSSDTREVSIHQDPVPLSQHRSDLGKLRTCQTSENNLLSNSSSISSQKVVISPSVSSGNGHPGETTPKKRLRITRH